MKKLIVTLFIIAFLNSTLEFFFPWWILSIVCFAVCYIARLSNASSFVAGFGGIGISWLLMILIKDIPNQHLLSTKMATLFPFGGNFILFIVVNILIGAIVGGLSGLSGRMMNSQKS